MSNLVACPTCGRKLKAPPNLIGKKVQCPGCDKMFTLPETTPEVEEAPAEKPAAVSYGLKDEGSSSSDQEEASRDRRRPCPSCGEMISATATRCRHCGEEFDESVPRRGGRRRIASGRMVVMRRIDILSSGKVMGTMYAIIGLIGGAIITLLALVGAMAGLGGNANVAALGMGMFSIIILPIMYGIGGFIGGIIMACIYNIVASLVGGIAFELD